MTVVADTAVQYSLIPVCETFIADCETPVSAFLKLRALAPHEPAFLLESADQGQRVGRWSFIGIRPRKVLRWSLADGGDPYTLAATHVARHRQAPLPDALTGGRDGNGPPFIGGAVGFFGYDLVRTVEPLGEPAEDPLGLPDMALMLTDALVVFDHLKRTITILANADSERHQDLDDALAQARLTIGEIRRALAGPVPSQAGVGALGASGSPPGSDAESGLSVEGSEGATRTMPRFESNMTEAQFEGMVQRIVEYIHAGDAFQVVPSQRWSAPIPVHAFSIYRGLRAVNPSPYMYYLDFGDFQIAGASPEPLLTVSASGRTDGRMRVSTRPIAGTRPRGANVAEDEQIAQELLDDEKERAEHVMLVDLGRNDLGRVCQPGTVEVETFMAVETYSHVMHIVSSVTGLLSEDISAMDALRSVLPAGTLSGAPKVRAMQIIDKLEPIKRGGYGGAIGYLSYDGEMDTCIHIRTVVVKDGHAHVQAGGGTVADAKPEYELAESQAKAQAVLKAIELAIDQPEWL